MVDNKCLEAALKYVAFGFSVIPVKRDKTPYLSWTEFQQRRATPEEIKEWFKKWPDTNVAIVTGAISKICVVDIDSNGGKEKFLKLLPDNAIPPTVNTPSGFWHLYFQTLDKPLGNNTGALPGVDFRCEGGYAVAPPSLNGDGQGWEWQPGLSIFEVEPPPPPDAYIEVIINSLYKSITKDNLQHLTDLTTPYKMFMEGRRDNDLFHAANCLVKGGMARPEIEQVLNILAKSCNPPFPEKEISVKINSAIQRTDRRERNIREEFLSWLTLQEGYINLTEACKTLQLLTKEEKNHLYVLVHRLKAEGIIEKYGNKAGEYRRIDKEFERVDFMNATGEEADISLPLGLNEIAKLYPGNIGIVAGSKEAGKTAFLLNIAKMNLGKKRIVYLNSEMGADEIRNRLMLFDDTTITHWHDKMEVFNLKTTQTPADFIDGSETIWFVDYLEIAEDFSKIALPIAKIHEKLGKGLAFIGIQKADGKEIGRGADFSREKARLYLSLDWDHEKKLNRIKIIDCKAWRNRNPRGMVRYYKLVKGSKFLPTTEWAQ